MPAQDLWLSDTEQKAWRALVGSTGAVMATLDAIGAWLVEHPGENVTIEGHCDERGTREYNLALGERRAQAVANYLAAAGVDPSRMRTINYGKERPAMDGASEAAWAQNRRAVFVQVN